MIFSRRSLQKRLDEIRDDVPEEWHSDLVQRLNTPNRDRIAAVYELVVAHGLHQHGDLAVELQQSNGKKPDIAFQGADFSFVADVTSVSDSGLDKKNPYENLSEMVERLKDKLGLPAGGVDISIGSFREHKDRGEQTKLRMPDKSSLTEYFDKMVAPEIRRQHTVGTSPIHLELADDATEITITIDPAKCPYSSGGYASYDRPSIRSRNPFFKALKAKAQQLKSITGITGIIICDADCATMAYHGLGNPTELAQSLAEDFLRQNSSVDFVLMISIRESQSGWHPTAGVERAMDCRLVTQKDFEHQGGLDNIFQQMLSHFPYPRDMPINAARRAVESGYGWGNHGAYRMSGDSLRLSSRMIMELLSGEITVEQMEKLQKQNPFKLPFSSGKLPTKIEVISGGEDENDDWIEFTFGDDDPAISPFK